MMQDAERDKSVQCERGQCKPPRSVVVVVAVAAVVDARVEGRRVVVVVAVVAIVALVVVARVDGRLVEVEDDEPVEPGTVGPVVVTIQVVVVRVRVPVVTTGVVVVSDR